MKQILVYSDSLTWGIIPDTRKRLPFAERWPGVLEQQLIAGGANVRVLENCLNGRRTVWEDPYKPGRNGLQGVGQVMEMHSPLTLVILMLGTNDFQSMHPHTAWHAAQGVAAIIDAMRSAPIEPGMPVPPILLVCPPVIQTPRGAMAAKFAGAGIKCVGLAEAYRRVASDMGCEFLDAGEVTAASGVDGIHLDKPQHLQLGMALAKKVKTLL